MTTSGISGISSLYYPTITFSGLSSEIDYQSIIEELVEAESYTIERMEAWKAEWNDKIEALNTLTTNLTEFRTSVAGMDTLVEFQTKSASSSDETIITAAASSTATAGTHEVLVNQLAQSETEVHSGVSASDTVINSSGSTKQFDYTYNGQTESVTVADGATLTDLVNAINNSGSNPGVTASILNLGTGTDPYRLVLRGNNTGADYTITIEATTTLDGTGGTLDFTAATFTESQSAQNAQLRVDGYPAAGWIERASNTIADVITGVTLNLQSTSASSIRITITDDLTAQQEKIEDLVAKYNAVISYIKEQTEYDPETGEAGLLLGNYAVNIVKARLNAIGTGNAPGFANGIDVDNPDTYINLAQIGITTDTDETSPTFGQLLIDTTELQTALQTAPQAVANLLAVYFKGVNEDAAGNVTYYSYIPGITQPGRYLVHAETDGSNITAATIDGHPVTISGDTITGNSGYPEAGLTVRINLATGTYDEYVRLQLGINGDFKSELDELLDSTSGPINILIDNYNDIIDSIDDKIELEQRRVEALRRRLTRQFAALDALLAQLNEQSNYLSSQLQKLNQSG